LNSLKKLKVIFKVMVLKCSRRVRIVRQTAAYVGTRLTFSFISYLLVVF